MTVTLLLLAVIMGVVVWWIVKQTVNIKPWIADGGVVDGGPVGEIATGRLPLPIAKIGLFVFLAVVTSLFALFISAYMMRMEYGDWRPLTEPGLLWINTGLLVLSSALFQLAKIASGRGLKGPLKLFLYSAGAITCLFIVGQLMAWQQLNDSGYLVTTNPAIAFFYLITGLHGIHLLGGLVAWLRACVKLHRGASLQAIGLSVDLCAFYWHFLLVAWLVLFGLMLST